MSTGSELQAGWRRQVGGDDDRVGAEESADGAALCPTAMFSCLNLGGWRFISDHSRDAITAGSRRNTDYWQAARKPRMVGAETGFTRATAGRTGLGRARCCRNSSPARTHCRPGCDPSGNR